VPDAYPSLDLIPSLTAPLLVLHGDADEIVPVEHGRALYDAARVPKRIGVLRGFGHNDLVMAGTQYADVIAGWAADL
jgi:fermentation-respiration switch protein FrsA (DUF1100 family)